MSYDAEPPDTRTDMEKTAEAFRYLAACVRLRGRRLDREYIRSRQFPAPPMDPRTVRKDDIP